MLSPQLFGHSLRQKNFTKGRFQDSPNETQVVSAFQDLMAANRAEPALPVEPWKPALGINKGTKGFRDVPSLFFVFFFLVDDVVLILIACFFANVFYLSREYVYLYIAVVCLFFGWLFTFSHWDSSPSKIHMFSSFFPTIMDKQIQDRLGS